MRKPTKKKRKKENLANIALKQEAQKKARAEEQARRRTEKEEKTKEILQKYSQIGRLSAPMLVKALIELNPETLEEGDMVVLQELSNQIYYAGMKLTHDIFKRLVYPLGYTYGGFKIDSSEERFFLRIA